MFSVTELDQRFYPRHADNWDDVLFRDFVLSHLNDHTTILEIGAGRGALQHMNFRDKVRRAIGIDIEGAIITNPNLHFAVVADAATMPFHANVFDIVMANNVLEHLSNPEATFKEIARVLRPGGVFFAKTPNKFHYMPLFARLTPHQLHIRYNKLRGRRSDDTFRTRYLANSKSTIRRLARNAGLKVDAIDLIEGRPEYCRLNLALYALGILYERLVNAFEMFAGIRILIVAKLLKPNETKETHATARAR